MDYRLVHCIYCRGHYTDNLNLGKWFSAKFNSFQPFPDHSRHFLPLIFCLYFLESFYCKHYGPRSDFSFRSSLIRAHSVRFHNQNMYEVNFSVHLYSADVKSRLHFQDKNYWQDKD